MAGSETSLSELFQAHARGLAGAVRSVLGAGADVAEVLQDAFLRAFGGWQRGERPRDPVAWIFVVTWNTAIDHRRRQRRQPIALDELPMQPTVDTPPGEGLERQEELARAQRAIERLGDHEKQVFLLRTAGGLSFAAVAVALGIPEGTAKTRMRSALQRLRWALGAAGGADLPGTGIDGVLPGERS